MQLNNETKLKNVSYKYMKFKSSHIKSDNFLRSNNKPVKKSFKKHARQSMKIDSEDNDMTDTTTSSGINFGSDVLLHSISKRRDNVHKKIPTFKLMRTKAISRKGKEFKSFKVNHTFNKKINTTQKKSCSNLNKGQTNSSESFKNELLQNQLDIADEQSDTQVSSNTQLINVSRRGTAHAQQYFDNKRYTHSTLRTTANNKQFAYQLEFSDSDSVQRIKKLTPKEQQIRGIKKSYSGQVRLLIQDATSKIKEIPSSFKLSFKKGLASFIKTAKGLISAKGIGAALILVTLLAFVGMAFMAIFGSLSSMGGNAYTMSDVSATKIQQIYAEKELDYMEMILKEADEASGNAQISYDPVGHEPHELLALFNVLSIPELEKDRLTYRDIKNIEALIEQLIEVRYDFEKIETDEVVDIDGEKITVTNTSLISRTNSFYSLAFDSSSNMAVQDFINMVSAHAVEIADTNGLYASVMIAQAILESNGGNLSKLASPPHYNLFGIKGSYNGQSVTLATAEDDGTGNQFIIHDDFRDYPSYKESLEDYANVLKNQPRPGYYSGAWKSNTTNYQDATAFLQGRYATDTKYASKLNKIIQQYNLTSFDVQSTDLDHLLEEANEQEEAFVAEQNLEGNPFSLTTFEKDLWEQQMKMRGFVGTYPSPIKDFDWNNNIRESFGTVWDEKEEKRYTTDSLHLNTPLGSIVESQLIGTVEEIGENEKGAYLRITNKETIMIEYSGLTAISVSVGDQLKTGDAFAKTTEDGLFIKMTKNNELLNPQIMMWTENPKPIQYAANRNSNVMNVNLPTNNDLNTNMVSKAFDGLDVQSIFNEANKFIGYPYVWGGSSPSTSFDCSGFIVWVYNQSGVKKMERTTAQGIFSQYTAPISEEEARPGDLVFFENTYPSNSRYTHVGIYAGKDEKGYNIMLHAGNPIGYASIDINYWQSHSPQYARIVR
jgi:flagellum-specific peptidoglycan hydrolase FlgJ/cell wall-associated NlpC family hydrolase